MLLLRKAALCLQCLHMACLPLYSTAAAETVFSDFMSLCSFDWLRLQYEEL